MNSLDAKAMPDWVMEDPDITRSKWVEEEILTLSTTEEEGTSTLELSSEDGSEMVDYGGRYNPRIAKQELDKAFEEIDTVDGFFESRAQLRKVLEGNQTH